MKNTADVAEGKPIDVWSQSISGVSAVSPSVAFLVRNIYKIMLLDHYKNYVII
jgi:hypothetical protein